jgi:FtsH-binding integral membrane protein
VAIADLLGEATILLIVATFLAALGILISTVWAVLLHRTNDAQRLWREAALRLELGAAPIEGEFRAPITLRSGDQVPIDLSRPFLAHAERFSNAKQISWMDRVDPSSLTEILPMTFFGIWTAVLVLVWFWYVVLR